MEIIELSVESYERMYCPSTDEIILAPNEEINDTADALKGYWHCESMDEPEIKDSELKKAWNDYYENYLKDKDLDWDDDDYRKFFQKLDRPDWIAWECVFHGIACGPVSFTVIFVVKADTVIEEDPEYDEH
jgi:hypothetical protein